MRFGSLVRCLAVAFLLCGVAGVASGANYTWYGGLNGDPSDNDWDTDTNWSPQGIPGSSDNVYFPADTSQNADLQLYADKTVTNLTMQNVSSFFSLYGGCTLTVSGNATLRGDVNLYESTSFVVSGQTSIFAETDIHTGVAPDEGTFTTGTLRLSSGSLNVLDDGSVTVTGLTTVAGNLRRITIDPAATATVTLAGGLTLNSLATSNLFTLEGNNSSITVQGDITLGTGGTTNATLVHGNGDLIIDSNVTISENTSGTATFTANDLTVTNNATLTVSSTSPPDTINLNGSLTVNSGSTFTMSGVATPLTASTTTASIESAAGTVTLNNVSVPSGKALTLNRDVTVGGTLTLTSGEVKVADGKTLTVAGKLTSTGGTLSGATPSPTNGYVVNISGDADVNGLTVSGTDVRAGGVRLTGSSAPTHRFDNVTFNAPANSGAGSSHLKISGSGWNNVLFLGDKFNDTGLDATGNDPTYNVETTAGKQGFAIPAGGGGSMNTNATVAVANAYQNGGSLYWNDNPTPSEVARFAAERGKAGVALSLSLSGAPDTLGYRIERKVGDGRWRPLAGSDLLETQPGQPAQLDAVDRDVLAESDMVYRVLRVSNLQMTATVAEARAPVPADLPPEQAMEAEPEIEEIEADEGR